ncbi:GEVED domain-containing protein [Adhaeribacter pallidiroseus]|nr:GEVED domain-containing protein [Adhaeribacter pallidiroseus]
MKVLYPFLCLLSCLLSSLTLLAQTQKNIYLGSVANVTAAYRANFRATQTAAQTSKINYAIPGQKVLQLTVRKVSRLANEEVFTGSVGTGKNNPFFLKVSQNKAFGYVVLKDQKKAYQYTSTPTGEAYLQEIDIDKAICFDYKRFNSKTAPAPRQTSALTAAIPELQSLPGAQAVVYLDFDGGKETHKYWNDSVTIDAKPANLSQSEIVAVWKKISEDFRPFALNITTSPTVYKNAPAKRRMRVIFTPTDTVYPGVGGVAWPTSFTWGDDTPCWVFNSGIITAGEAGSHEIGHTLGLSHDGRILADERVEEYYDGGQFGNWAPIMGIGYYKNQVQWSKGEYPQANNQEDDLKIITSRNGFTYRTDDHGNSSSNARPLVASSTGIVLAEKNKGMITTQADQDVFSFTLSNSGSINLQVKPPSEYINADTIFTNLDLLLTLKNSAGTTVVTAPYNYKIQMASLTPLLPAGTYYLFVAGVKGEQGAQSDYSSLGEYTISGNLSATYCLPVVTGDCSSDYINDFKFNSLVNSNSGCNGQKNAYNVYAPTGTLTTQVNRGQTYNISLKAGPENPEGFGVWIDYNNDNDFNDADEFVYQSPSAIVNETYTGKVTIPKNAVLGQRRLRVRARYYERVTSTDFCSEFDYGETEDYTITIANPSTASQWDVRYGGSGSEGLAETIKTTDGGYLLAGYSGSGVSGDKSQASRGSNDYWVLKTDALGNKIWDQRYGGTGQDYLNRVIQTQDGGYLLAGSSESGLSRDKSQSSRGNRDYWIVKISGSGAKQWDKRYGGSGYDELKKVMQLSTGEYLLGGYSDSPAGGDKSQDSQGGLDYWLVKINSAGGKIWDQRYGGNMADSLENFILTSDNGFLLGGASLSGQSGDKSQASQGGEDFWLVRTDKDGKKLWDKRYGGSRADHLYSISSLPNAEFLIAGCSVSGNDGDKSQSSQGGKDFWLLKLNNNGAKIWDKRLGGTGDDELRSVVRTSDGGFLLTGKSASGATGDKSQNNQGGTDYWVVKTTADGTKQWDKRFGGSGAEELRNVLITSDNDYLLCGRSDSGISGDKTQSSRGSSDFWLIKINANIPSGSSIARASEVSPSAIARLGNPEQAWNTGLIAYPNPFTDQITVRFALEQTEPIVVQLYNSLGQLVTTLYQGEARAMEPYTHTWQPAQKATAGMYFIRLTTPTKTYQQKVLLQR